MKLTAKNVMFILMSVLLVLTVVMALITLGRVGSFLQLGGAPNTNTPQNNNTISSSVPNSSGASSNSIVTEPGHEHEYVKTDTYSPNCLSSGYSLYECSCGKTDIRDFKDPYGHNYGDATVIAPTCTTDGWTERTCSRCNNTEKTNIIAAAHIYSDWVSDTDTTEQRTCYICDIIEIRSLDTANKWVIRLSALETENGFAHYQVIVDLADNANNPAYDIYTELTEALRFDYVNNTLCIYYTAGSVYSVPTGATVVTFYADGNVTTAQPVITPEPDTGTEDPNPDIGGGETGSEGTGSEGTGGEGTGGEGTGGEGTGGEETGSDEVTPE